jgi:D-sedoheptulose 7-phosphate isomerase
MQPAGPSSFREYCLTVARNFEQLADLEAAVQSAAEVMKAALRDGKKVMFCGNGGSAADSQHLAAELMGRFLLERQPLPALALTTDTSTLTAIGNDYAYEEVFARQIRGIGRPGDVLVAISTSGRSKNILRALDAAREGGLKSIGLTGQTDGMMCQLCDICIAVPATATHHIQEMHIAVGHAICGEVERDLCASAKA